MANNTLRPNPPNMMAQNSVDILGDLEYFGCGCESLVDPKTGEGKIQHQCMKHRVDLHLADYLLESLR